jgi:NAD(P)-dependent dehydrogenase (short-subunit alcohol dehydrogenase family)
MRFRNKIILVTGAAQNTGLGIAARVAAEGATVFLNDKTAEAVGGALAVLRRRGLKKLVGLPGDIGVPADVEQMFREISAKAKRLDVLVNNAAHLGVGPAVLDMQREFFEAVVRVNLVGTFHVSQQAARLMKRHGGGAIVSLGSNVSTRAIRQRSAYLASKGGIDALTLALAVEFAPFGIRVNTVAPGYIHSDRWATLAAAQVRRRRANVPLGRESTPEDIAQAVLFLASDQAANITGARLVVDGGCSAQLFPGDVEA